MHSEPVGTTHLATRQRSFLCQHLLCVFFRHWAVKLGCISSSLISPTCSAFILTPFKRWKHRLPVFGASHPKIARRFPPQTAGARFPLFSSTLPQQRMWPRYPFPPIITEPKARKNIPLIQHILVKSAPLGWGQMSWGWNIRKNQQNKGKFAHIERSPHSCSRSVFIKTLLEQPHSFTVLHVWISHPLQ